MRAPLLRRIAEETGGVFYTPQTVASLAEDVKYTGRGVTTVEERDLWDMPIVLFLLLTVMLGEWSYRRVRHLASSGSCSAHWRSQWPKSNRTCRRTTSRWPTG